MSTLSERDGMMQESIRLKIANRLMEEEMKRLQPDLKKYENCVHPASRPVQPETVSTSTVTEKTDSIKQEASKLKVVENDLTTLNKRVTTLFNDVETKISQRDTLFSEIEQATSQMNSLTIGSPRFEEESCNLRNTVQSDSSRMKSMTSTFQEKLKDKLSRSAALQKSQSDLDRTIRVRQQSTNVLQARKAEFASKIDLDSLAQLKVKLAEMTEKTGTLNEYIASVTQDEGQRLESLTSSITECEILKKKKEDLTKQLDELNSREEETVIALDEKKKQVEESQMKLKQLEFKKELLSKNHEIAMTELKDRIDPVIESLKSKKEAAERQHEAVRRRIETREECMSLRKELEAEGKVDELDLSEVIESLKQEIEDTRANITKTIGETEYYRSTAARWNAEADELQLVDKRRREEEEKTLHQKDGVANHYEREIFNLKKKLEEEKKEKENRLAQETRRLLEKAKEDKERKEKEEKRRVEREKEKEKEKIRKAKEEEEKKRKKAIEEQEKKKKDEAKNRMINAVQNKESSAILTRVQQRRKNMETAAAIPFAHNDGAVIRPPPLSRAPPPVNLRRQSIPKKSIFMFDDESSEDDDEDDDFLNESTRVMPKVPEKYAGSPPRVDKKNPFELSFTDVQSSTPVRSQNNPAPAFELSFNQVVTSTPQLPKGSKNNKKQTRPRGKKRAK